MQPYVKQTAKDPLWCPPSAMVECDPIKEVNLSTAVKPFAVDLIGNYGVCKFKQKVLADCITQYEAKDE